MAEIKKINGEIFLIDGENEILVEKFKFTTDGYLKIPENSSRRTLVKYSKIEELNDGESYVLKDKVDKIFSGNSGRVSQQKILEYISEEDRKLYDEIMERARIAYEKANVKPELTELEKAELAVKKAMEKLKKLQEAQA